MPPLSYHIQGGIVMKVVGFGDNVVDKYLHTRTYYPGGNCVNFSVYANKLGAESAYLGVVGTDEMATHILETLNNFGVETSSCLQLEGSTGCCEVTLEDGDRKFVSWNGGGITLEKPMVLGEKELNYLNDFDLIHSGCYSKIESEIPKLKEKKALISFDFSEDPEFREDKYLEQICPYIDFALFSSANQSTEEIKVFIHKISKYGTKYILVTRGIDGAVFYDGTSYYLNNAHVVENPVDTMGCGDSFVTRFLIHLLENGWTKSRNPAKEVVKEGLEKASLFAAENCYVKGAFDHGKKF